MKKTVNSLASAFRNAGISAKHSATSFKKISEEMAKDKTNEIMSRLFNSE